MVRGAGLDSGLNQNNDSWDKPAEETVCNNNNNNNNPRQVIYLVAAPLIRQ